ncbi:MAG: response regulator [Oscillospiraceae bacterium]|nr:response regulator [Oscillospiraceae bacterium]
MGEMKLKADEYEKPCILAVDDVPVVLNAITAALESDYRVFCLTKGKQVEKFLSMHTPELFLLDIEMPGMNGHELTRVIRGFKEHKNTPIIFLTGNATFYNYQTAMEEGAADFVAKPVDPSVLLEKVKSLINR